MSSYDRWLPATIQHQQAIFQNQQRSQQLVNKISNKVMQLNTALKSIVSPSKQEIQSVISARHLDSKRNSVNNSAGEKRAHSQCALTGAREEQNVLNLCSFRTACCQNERTRRRKTDKWSLPFAVLCLMSSRSMSSILLPIRAASFGLQNQTPNQTAN